MSFANCFTWRMLSNNHGSDHFPIVITYLNSEPDKYECRPHFVTSRLDWISFSTKLESFTRELMDKCCKATSPLDPVSKISSFYDLIDSSLRNNGARIKRY